MIALLNDPRDALERLEAHSIEPVFLKRWRAFMRACAQTMLPRLPAQAGDWMASADAYERGLLTQEALAGIRVRAWQFHDARKDGSNQDESSGLRVVMYRLWPESGVSDWYESAWHFLQFCRDAGLGDDALLRLLREHFGELLSGAGTA